MIDLVFISSKSFTPLSLRHSLILVSVERAHDADERHQHDAAPEPGVLDVVQVVRWVDEQAAHGRADQALVDVGRVGRGELGGPLGGNAPPEYPSIATFASLGSPTSFELSAARIESSVFIPYSGPAAKSARWPSMSGTMTAYPSRRNAP